MKLREELTEARSIFIDTAPFIYYVEAHPKYGRIAKEIFDSFQAKECKAFSSVFTLTEVLPKPIQVGNEQVLKKFTELFSSGDSLSLTEITYSIAEKAGMLRGKYPWLKTIDSLQLAASLNMNAKLFITNDKPLKRINEINILILEDYV